MEEWTAHLRGQPPHLPEGAAPWPWFMDLFRSAMNRPWEWQRDKAKKNGKLWRTTEDWGIQWEDTMEGVQKWSINVAINAGTWDRELGMDRLSPRYEECQRRFGASRNVT